MMAWSDERVAAIKSALVTIGARSVWVQIEVNRRCSLTISVNKPKKFEKR